MDDELQTWYLTSGSAPDLWEALRPHHRPHPDGNDEILWVGRGWKELVQGLHGALKDSFPDYRFALVKQKWGQLQINASPSVAGIANSSREEVALLNGLIERCVEQSLVTCEACGVSGALRDDRSYEITLCDSCNEQLPDPPDGVFDYASG